MNKNFGNFGINKSFYSFAGVINYSSALEIQERIVFKSDELFRKYGIRGVTMDDIARQIGVSKKTIYQFFPDKDELIMAVTRFNLDANENEVKCCSGMEADNAVDEMIKAIDSLTNMMQGYNPVMFYDLQKYHPKAWQLFADFKNTFLFNTILANLERGIREGLYRNDFDLEIVALMRLEQIDMVFRLEVFPPARYQITKVMAQLTEHFLYGVVTLKGHKLVNNYRNLKEEE